MRLLRLLLLLWVGAQQKRRQFEGSAKMRTSGSTVCRPTLQRTSFGSPAAGEPLGL